MTYILSVTQKYPGGHRQYLSSVKALSKHLERDYKNVHVDCAELERVDLIERNEEGLLVAPWDAINAQFQLVA